MLEPGFKPVSRMATISGGKDGNFQSKRPKAIRPGDGPSAVAPKDISAKRICDIVRLMFVCQTSDDMATLLDLISKAKDIEVVRFKDRITEPSGGWRDAMINFRIVHEGYSHICEVQIVHKKMAMCRQKDGLGGHDEYARERNAREILHFLGIKAIAESPASPNLQHMLVGALWRRSSRNVSSSPELRNDGSDGSDEEPEEPEKPPKASEETTAPRVTLTVAANWALSGAGVLRRFLHSDPGAAYRAHRRTASVSLAPQSLRSSPQPPGMDKQGASGSPVVSSFVDTAAETAEDLEDLQDANRDAPQP